MDDRDLRLWRRDERFGWTISAEAYASIKAEIEAEREREKAEAGGTVS